MHEGIERFDGDRTSVAAQADAREFTMLENNPDVMNELARSLGVAEDLCFHDVYSLYDADVLAMVPRPVYALLATIPMSQAWMRDRDAEDADLEWYAGSGAQEPVMWFQQTIIHGCGLIGLLHCVSNGTPGDMVVDGTLLAQFLEQARPLAMADRAQLLRENDAMYEASEAVARHGDSDALQHGSPGDINHFVALVKVRDGNLWELERARKGPLNRGALAGDEDALSELALDLGIRRLVYVQRKSGVDLPFYYIALARKSG